VQTRETRSAPGCTVGTEAPVAAQATPEPIVEHARGKAFVTPPEAPRAPCNIARTKAVPASTERWALGWALVWGRLARRLPSDETKAQTTTRTTHRPAHDPAAHDTRQHHQPTMEDQVAALLAALKKPSTNVDTRLQLFAAVKSSIKHGRVPEACQDSTFECICIAMTASTSAALVSTGFATLSHFIKRLQLQDETSIITSQSGRLLTILVDRLGDARESHRHAAGQLLADLHPLCPQQVETLIQNAMKGANPRAKEASMPCLVKVCAPWPPNM
jgi:hypothetical protein